MGTCLLFLLKEFAKHASQIVYRYAPCPLQYRLGLFPVSSPCLSQCSTCINVSLSPLRHHASMCRSHPPMHQCVAAPQFLPTPHSRHPVPCIPKIAFCSEKNILKNKPKIPSVPSFDLPNGVGKSAQQKVRFDSCIFPTLPRPSLSPFPFPFPFPFPYSPSHALCTVESLRAVTCEHHCILHSPGDST